MAGELANQLMLSCGTFPEGSGCCGSLCFEDVQIPIAHIHLDGGSQGCQAALVHMWFLTLPY